ncbi:phage prohead protease, HK97 family [Paenibacillus larvae subsp. larvae]|uniref:Phage prohead protease, HK97 family n=1 Tax=Paenibacillus larvae subsp. larvae TaxID=147375 RepID=A0A2L1UA87_9BACL|nr:HK97 family phage prohead protease [Paenibacillus larvae]AVF25090.1 phage prohead protease, HK97 family [Paenibacillus larvae subsp. larvae]AVF29854.1 phage prohead protease, HK97 family [Paenibacillus larvae subsp. larvae]
MEEQALEIRTAEENEGPILTGYAAVFNKPALIRDRRGDTYYEEIVPGAFKRSLSGTKEVFALRNHDSNALLGSTLVNLKLWEDNYGLGFELRKAGTPDFENAYAAVKSKLLRYCSFGFNVAKGGEKWSVRNKIPYRRITDVNLGEISLTHIPAYSQTSVEVRSIVLNDSEDDIEKERQQRWNELIKKYIQEGK